MPREKSVVSNYLRELGASVFDADAVSRRAVVKGSEGLEEVLGVLGAEYATKDGDLDRAKVASKFFTMWKRKSWRPSFIKLCAGRRTHFLKRKKPAAVRWF